MTPSDLKKFYKGCFKITLNDVDLYTLVNRFDANGDGHIEWAEFIAQVKNKDKETQG